MGTSKVLRRALPKLSDDAFSHEFSFLDRTDILPHVARCSRRARDEAMTGALTCARSTSTRGAMRSISFQQRAFEFCRPLPKRRAPMWPRCQMAGECSKMMVRFPTHARCWRQRTVGSTCGGRGMCAACASRLTECLAARHAHQRQCRRRVTSKRSTGRQTRSGSWLLTPWTQSKASPC